MRLRQKCLTTIIPIAAIALLLSKFLVHILTESWWFEAIGFSEVFWTRLTWQILVWAATFVLYSLFLWGNYRIARYQRHKGKGRLVLVDRTVRAADASGLKVYAGKIANYAVLGLIFFLSISAASISSPSWETILKFLNATNFGSSDPIFQQDIGFYCFIMPLYEGMRNWLGALFGCAAIASALVYGFDSTIPPQWNWQNVLTGRGKLHLSLLLAAIAAIFCFDFWLKRYELLYSAGGIVFGAGYTDVHAKLFAYSALSVLLSIVAFLLALSAWQRSFRLPMLGVGVTVIALVTLDGIYPWFQQQFIVSPNELAKEKPYIEHNIQFTQAAYRLSDVQRQSYAAEAKLNRQVLQNNQPTVRNVRLWDYRPLLSTYRQLQEIRLYYKFAGVDVDRYTLNGNYQQVMLTARELSFAKVPREAQTWVNQRLKYTHGYGLVMSPVNQITSDGLPELYIKDIPPSSSVDVQVSQPAIYYGEETDAYIFTGTSTPEFDYPLGDANAFTHYNGAGGVPMPSIWHRLAYAYDLGNIEVLISNYFTDRSRIHYYRQIKERVEHIAPFLRFDSDPYPAVINGKLMWLVDAYTVSDRYPYSEPIARSISQSKDAEGILKGGNLDRILRGNINYIRNSVKVVVDAYDGTVRFFAIDETDPVLKTYGKIFPHLFEPRAGIPPEIKAHFRYPLDLFKIQSQMYLTYHMNDAEVFYNREDLWRFPLQTYEGGEQMMEPYYAIVQLPNEPKEGFILILPFTPANKDNAIAWLAARSNGQEYGKLLLYEFPKQKLVYGPRQIEARIDQDPTISQQFTLWSQAGSKVIRGDLLVIPIAQSLLYAEPVYLRAEQGELPELKRVIVAYDKAVVMEETLDKSLAAIFGSDRGEKEAPSPVTGVSSTLVKSALETYQKAQEALRQGNWAEYGRYQQELEGILLKLNQETGIGKKAG
ncbi:UPF0182 family protein [Pseudanabaena sp. PCC 6802]|uniref:UPF0182 family membrane protein n=1 Tax=Pseudanabaena sp. PCC 6802 TaxID=118173 RepID=UPI0003489BCF|nr:UPF0182 family protein [Pseudanabaena sp. PCC 6802]